MTRAHGGIAITIAVAIDDAELADRIVAALTDVDDVRLVREGEPADVVLVSRRDGSDAAQDADSEATAIEGHVPAGARSRAPARSELTPREHEVLALLVEGASNKAIARRLGISVHTAKFHVRSLLEKLDAIGRTDAVTHAARLGVIRL